MGRGKEGSGQEHLKQGCTIGQRRTGVKVTENIFFFLKVLTGKLVSITLRLEMLVYVLCCH